MIISSAIQSAIFIALPLRFLILSVASGLGKNAAPDFTALVRLALSGLLLISSGNRTTEALELPTGLDQSWLYSYDEHSRLIDAHMGEVEQDQQAGVWSFVTAGRSRELVFGLDELGNRSGAMAGGILFPGHTDTIDPDSSPSYVTHSHSTTVRNEIATLYTGGSGTPPTSTGFLYDNAGRLRSDGVYFYEYDAWGRLVEVSEVIFIPEEITVPDPVTGEPQTQLIYVQAPGPWLVHYTYDALGRLVRRQVPTGVEREGVLYEDYYYDGIRRIQERIGEVTSQDPQDPIEMADRPWDFGGVPEPTRDYIYAAHPGAGVDDLLCEIADDPAAPSYVVQDPINSNVLMLIDAGGTPALQYTYLPYGQVKSVDVLEPGFAYRSRMAAHGMPLERLDEPWDSIADPVAAGLGSAVLYHARNRVYSPAIGRFIQRDPNATALVMPDDLTWHRGREPVFSKPDIDVQFFYQDGFSLFAYVGNNPITNSDPFGLFFGGLIGILGGPTTTLDIYSDYNQEVIETGVSAKGSFQGMLEEYSFWQQYDADWASDWSAPDNGYSGAVSIGASGDRGNSYDNSAPLMAGIRGPGKMMKAIGHAAKVSKMAKPSMASINKGIREAQKKVGSLRRTSNNTMPKGNPHGGPRWVSEDGKRSYRLEPPHPSHKPSERVWHINWEDWSEGKARGRSGVIPLE